ncbi:hypothetical protein ACFLZG_08065 [Thermodesulfobacteriota bacterium]
MGIIVLSSYAQDDGSQFTNFAGFDLDSVNLSQVEQKYGSTILIETGDAGEYVAKICYRLGDGILYFMSGEMGGPDHDLLGFTVSSLKNTEECANFPSIKYNLTLNLAGLHLGMSRVDFEYIFTKKVEWLLT